MDEQAVDVALLAVSEPVVNAVEHALPPVALHLAPPSGEGVVRIEVEDGGPAPDGGYGARAAYPTNTVATRGLTGFEEAQHYLNNLK